MISFPEQSAQYYIQIQPIHTAGYLLKQYRLSTVHKGTIAASQLRTEPTTFTKVTEPSPLTVTLHCCP